MPKQAKKIALYPGTFDPVTFGHMDILERAVRLFDEIVVGVAKGTFKSPCFALEERIHMLQTVSARWGDRVSIHGYERELTVDVMRKHGATVLLRGLRGVADFEYEMQLASMNRALAPDYDSIFLPPKDTFTCISSSLVREIASLGGDVSKFVHPEVERLLKQKYS